MCNGWVYGRRVQHYPALFQRAFCRRVPDSLVGDYVVESSSNPTSEHSVVLHLLRDTRAHVTLRCIHLAPRLRRPLNVLAAAFEGSPGF